MGDTFLKFDLVKRQSEYGRGIKVLVNFVAKSQARIYSTWADENSSLVSKFWSVPTRDFNIVRNDNLTRVFTHVHFDAMLPISQRMVGMDQRIMGEDGFQGTAILFVRQSLVPSVRHRSVIEWTVNNSNEPFKPNVSIPEISQNDRCHHTKR